MKEKLVALDLTKREAEILLSLMRDRQSSIYANIISNLEMAIEDTKLEEEEEE